MISGGISGKQMHLYLVSIQKIINIIKGLERDEQMMQ